MSRPTCVLTIAGSDSGGGAGIQADLKTFSALGCFGMSVITALTAQNTRGVRAIHNAPPEFVRAQIEAVLEDIGADAIKTGMLSTAPIIQVVAASLRRYGLERVVVDPVMVAASGDPLLSPDAVDTLRGELIPVAGLITPNLSETGVLLGRSVEAHEESMREAAGDLLSLGCGAALVKGGHGLGEESVDVLAWRRGHGVEHLVLRAPRIQTHNVHGTGCTLSSAIAALWGRGLALTEAVRQAKEYVTEAIRAGRDWRLGAGHGPVHHFWNWWGLRHAE